MSDPSVIGNSPAGASPKRTPHLHPDGDAGDTYRAVCIPAVIGLLIGLVSWAAFFSYLLWVVPLLAIVVSGYGLAQIYRYWPALTGAAAARWGIALGMVFGLGAVVHAGAQRWALEVEARRVANMWIELVRKGDLYRAHQLSLDPRARMDAAADLERGYEQSDALAAEYEEFAHSPFMQRMQQLPESARVRLLRFVEVARGPTTVRVRADLRAETGKPADDFNIEMVLYRMPDLRTGELSWRVNARLDSRSGGAGDGHKNEPGWGNVGHDP